MEPTAAVSEAEARRSAQDEILLEALASGRTYTEAGELAGVSDRTVARRIAEPAFARLVRDRRDEQVQTVAGQLSTMANTAVMAIASCLDDEVVCEYPLYALERGDSRHGRDGKRRLYRALGYLWINASANRVTPLLDPMTPDPPTAAADRGSAPKRARQED